MEALSPYIEKRLVKWRASTTHRMENHDSDGKYPGSRRQSASMTCFLTGQSGMPRQEGEREERKREKGGGTAEDEANDVERKARKAKRALPNRESEDERLLRHRQSFTNPRCSALVLRVGTGALASPPPISTLFSRNRASAFRNSKIASALSLSSSRPVYAHGLYA